MDTQTKMVYDFIKEGKTNEEIIALTGLSNQQIEEVRAMPDEVEVEEEAPEEGEVITPSDDDKVEDETISPAGEETVAVDPAVEGGDNTVETEVKPEDGAVGTTVEDQPLAGEEEVA
jgi:hypothetical protein